MYLSLGLHKERTQATGEAFSAKKKTSSTSKHENSLLFLYLWLIFALLDLDPGTQMNADPDQIRIHNPGQDPGYPSALQRKSHLCIPILGIARPQPQFPQSCVCERFR
jgi:hypothetical protein